MKKRLELRRVIPAIILPLIPDYSIDEQGFCRHVRGVLGVSGITGIVYDAHAREVTLLTVRKRRAEMAIRHRTKITVLKKLSATEVYGEPLPRNPTHS